MHGIVFMGKFVELRFIQVEVVPCGDKVGYIYAKRVAA